MSTTYRGPIAATATWQTVMDAADHRCQCADGLCGSQHSKSGRRCDRTTDREQLLAAPGDLTLSPTAAAAVPVGGLRAWCQSCHRGAAAQQRAHDRELRKQTEPEPAALF